MSLKGFIFDLDGVIVHTDQFHYRAWKAVADKMGIYFDETINKRLLGVSRLESLEIILERYKGDPLTREEKAAIAEKKNEIYKELLNTLTRLDVEDMVRNKLAELRKSGYKLAIGSSSRNARHILEKVELLDAFDAISDGTNISRSKPDPEVFLMAADFLHLKPLECAVVEDARAGIDAAKAGGMTAIGMGEAASYEKTDIILNNFNDLSFIIESGLRLSNH